MQRLLCALGAIALVLTACSPTAAPAAAPASAPSGQAAPAAPTAGAAPPVSAALSPEVQRLIQAARDAGETELNVSWGSTSLGGPEALKQVEAWMNQTYGTNVKINLTPGPSMPDMGLKLSQERAAGQKASTDVYLGLETHIASVLPRDMLEVYDYTLLSPRIPREVVAEPNVAVEVYGSVPAILYNSDLVPRADVPRRLADVLDPRWKGKIAAIETGDFYNAVSLRPEWGADKMRAFVAQLSQQVGGLMRQSEEHRVISGEFLFAVLNNTHTAKQNQGRGAPLAAMIPEDVAQVNTLHLGVPQNSGHPNLGKLFINAMMSEQGQRVLYETYRADHFQLPGSQSAADLADLYAKGVPIQKVNVKLVVEHPELADLTREFQGMLRAGR
jgi:iron(III) transport system substrate-binding protein